jgi:chromatin modification-related protein VID21
LERHLRGLYKVTGCCHATLNGHQPRADDFVYNEPDEEERRFLEENDVTK